VVMNFVYQFANILNSLVFLFMWWMIFFWFFGDYLIFLLIFCFSLFFESFLFLLWLLFFKYSQKYIILFSSISFFSRRVKKIRVGEYGNEK
jgi:hypothetical protein